MLEFDFDNSRRINNLDLKSKLIPKDIVKLGVVMEQEKYNCLAKITDVETETLKFKLVNECNIPLDIGQEFEIIFMQKTGVYKVLVELEEVINNGEDLILKVRAKDKNYKIQNRSYFRLNIYKRINFTKITKFDAESEIQEYQGVIENISAAGVKLVTHVPLVKSSHLNLDISFAGLSFDKVIAKVSRVDNKATSFKEAEYYEAGLEFVWEDLSHQDELANWLNRQTNRYL
ncbi:PilZ domain-containing protein [Halanaerobacter jeridensis]|nr:PilZ domain-containing protein [Halanaerobacter jeridensis]